MQNTSPATERVPTQLQRARDLLTDRVAGLPSWVVLTQLFIGLGWLRAVAEKVINPQWWSGAVLNDFVSDHQEATLGWYQPFIDSVVIPAAPPIALTVVLGQLVAALSLMTGRRLTLGLSVGMFLNLNFLAAGAVTPSAFYLLAQGAIALWLSEQKPTAASIKGLGVVAALATFLAAASLPFISTIHPHEVIEDPAVMFAFGGSLTTLACLLATNANKAHRLTTPPRALATAANHTSRAFGGPGGAFSARVHGQP